MPSSKNVRLSLMDDKNMKDLTINAAIDYDLPPVFVGRHLIDGAVRSDFIVFLQPLLDHSPCLGHRVE